MSVLDAGLKMSLDDRLCRTWSARPCPACGSERSIRAFEDVGRREGLKVHGTYVRCLGCRSLYLNPMPTESVLQELYESNAIDQPGSDAKPDPVSLELEPIRCWRSVQRGIGRLMNMRPHSWPDEPGRGRRILDFGCSSGEKLIPYYQNGWRVAGLDLNRAAIASAALRFPEGTFAAEPVESLSVSEKFDVIRADNVIEHLSDPLRTLRALREHIVPGGRIFGYIPSGVGLSILLVRSRSVNCWVPFHLMLPSRKGVETLFRRAGFVKPAIRSFTPSSWWQLTARQLVATPGWALRAPSRSEQVAIALAKTSTPLWFLAALVGVGEEWVVEARQPE